MLPVSQQLRYPGALNVALCAAPQLTWTARLFSHRPFYAKLISGRFDCAHPGEEGSWTSSTLGPCNESINQNETIVVFLHTHGQSPLLLLSSACALYVYNTLYYIVFTRQTIWVALNSTKRARIVLEWTANAFYSLKSNAIATKHYCQHRACSPHRLITDNVAAFFVCIFDTPQLLNKYIPIAEE